MEKIEIILDNYSQEEKNEALLAAVETKNSTLIEFVLKLKPDFAVGGGKLLNYAIENGNIELLGNLLWTPEIVENQEIMNEGVRFAALSKRIEWFDVFVRLLEEGGSKDIALATLLENQEHKDDVIMWLIRHGAKAYIQPMHLERHPNVVDKIFKAGYGKSIQFSNMGFEVFGNNICKNNRSGVVKVLAKDRPDLVTPLTEIAVKGGYSRIVKLLHQENAITTIDDKLFEKAIYEKHYFTVKYLVESGIHELEFTDVIYAAGFGSVKMMFFLIEQFKLRGKNVDSARYELAIKVACMYNRKDTVVALLDAGYKCNFDDNIKYAATHGYIKMVGILMKYATKLNNATFNEAERLAFANNHVHLASKMRDYRRKNPNKFQ